MTSKSFLLSVVPETYFEVWFAAGVVVVASPSAPVFSSSLISGAGAEGSGVCDDILDLPKNSGIGCGQQFNSEH